MKNDKPKQEKTKVIKTKTEGCKHREIHGHCRLCGKPMGIFEKDD